MIIYYKYVIIIVYFIIENPMNENPIAIPSNKKYTWEKINLSKEALEKDIAQIKELDTATVWEKLMDYINHQPGKHTDLIKKQGIYSELYQIQQQEEINIK